MTRAALIAAYADVLNRKIGRPEHERGSSSDRPHAPGLGASEFASVGGSSSCVQSTRKEPERHKQSNANSCGETQDFADRRIFQRLGEGYFPSSRPKLSLISPDAASGQPNTNSADSTNHPRNQSPRSSHYAFRLGGAADLCGNED